MKAKNTVTDLDSTATVLAGDAMQLRGLLDVTEATPSSWSREDLAAMFRHQMSAPLDFDLAGEVILGATTHAALAELPAVAQGGSPTFGQLFLHATPPLGLLKLAKDFFKRTAKAHPPDSAEHQIAYFFYLFSVIVARCHHGARISQLSDAELRTGLDWALTQPWLDPAARKHLADARSRLAGK